jgi:hypothetical protein
VSRAAWWPEGAPYPRRQTRDYATFELKALLRFAGSLATEGQGGEAARVAELRDSLLAERAERAEIARRPFLGNCQ